MCSGNISTLLLCLMEKKIHSGYIFLNCLPSFLAFSNARQTSCLFAKDRYKWVSIQPCALSQFSVLFSRDTKISYNRSYTDFMGSVRPMCINTFSKVGLTV